MWKRIPADVKSSCPEIGKIWAVGQNMWKRDFPGTYKALNAAVWSDVVADVMKEVQGNFKYLYIAKQTRYIIKVIIYKTDTIFPI